MAGKPEILRELEGLPEDALKDVKEFIYSLKKYKGKRRAVNRNGTVLAKKQFAAIKRWAGKDLGVGFSGREHDAILYGDSK